MIMSVDNSIYLQLKSNITKDLGQTLYLKDVANISCTPDIKTQLEKLVVLPKEERGFVVITVVDIIEIIRLAMPGIPVSSIGEIKVYIEPDTK
ncbi:MAG TPA: stage V sporulation protein AA, partial [Clostridia bacterium]|nr:stage V sporulation protein AA [Clostridia bacterium]